MLLLYRTSLLSSLVLHAVFLGHRHIAQCAEQKHDTRYVVPVRINGVSVKSHVYVYFMKS